MGTKDFIKDLENEDTERLRLKIVTVKGKVADIVVQYESFIDDKWTPIVRYDCAHGFSRRDAFGIPSRCIIPQWRQRKGRMKRCL